MPEQSSKAGNAGAILTALAAVITAVTGFFVAFHHSDPTLSQQAQRTLPTTLHPADAIALPGRVEPNRQNDLQPAPQPTEQDNASEPPELASRSTPAAIKADAEAISGFWHPTTGDEDFSLAVFPNDKDQPGSLLPACKGDDAIILRSSLWDGHFLWITYYDDTSKLKKARFVWDGKSLRGRVLGDPASTPEEVFLRGIAKCSGEK